MVPTISWDWQSVRGPGFGDMRGRDGGFLPGVGEEGFLEEAAFKLGPEARAGRDRRTAQAAR